MQLRLIFCITREWSYPSITTTRKNVMPSSITAAANCNAEMTCHMVKRSRATTCRHLQTSHQPQVTTINVQNVATQHIGKGSHAQQKSTSAGYVINLAISQANVFRRSNITTRCTDYPRHIKYK